MEELLETVLLTFGAINKCCSELQTDVLAIQIQTLELIISKCSINSIISQNTSQGHQHVTSLIVSSFGEAAGN
jgi:hypothetical protein